MKTDLFQSCCHCWVFQICWHIECSTFTASSFRIWNSSTGIPSPPLALFIVMLSKAHLTSHSKMSDHLAPGEWSHPVYTLWYIVIENSRVKLCSIIEKIMPIINSFRCRVKHSSSLDSDAKNGIAVKVLFNSHVSHTYSIMLVFFFLHTAFSITPYLVWTKSFLYLKSSTKEMRRGCLKILLNSKSNPFKIIVYFMYSVHKSKCTDWCFSVAPLPKAKVFKSCNTRHCSLCSTNVWFHFYSFNYIFNCFFKTS